jgi:hypothetical protein
MSAQEQNDIHPKTAKDKAAKSEHYCTVHQKY